MVVAQLPGQVHVEADLSPAYAVGDGVNGWTRDVWLDAEGLLVIDDFDLDANVEAVFQVNVPVEPVISGGVATAGNLRIAALVPADATMTVVDWHAIDPGEYSGGGYKVEIRGSGDRFEVALLVRHELFADGFETGDTSAWVAVPISAPPTLREVVWGAITPATNRLSIAEGR